MKTRAAPDKNMTYTRTLCGILLPKNTMKICETASKPLTAKGYTDVGSAQ